VLVVDRGTVGIEGPDRRKTGGRKAGVLNKITREAKMALAELCNSPS
jgi:hypothetical protein